jgi:hypothetical protein
LCRRPDVEAEVKNWIMYHRYGGILMHTKIIVFEERQGVVTHGSTDFTWYVEVLLKHWRYIEANTITGDL